MIPSPAPPAPGGENRLGLLGIVLFFAESGPTLLLWLLILLIAAWLLWRRYQRSLAMS